MDLLNSISSNLASWVDTALTVVGAASAVAALTPSPKDDAVVSKLHTLLNFVALNVGYAKGGGRTAR